MRTWTRVASPRTCGNCGEVMKVGDPLLLIELQTRRPITLGRCAVCEGPAPPDLPLRIEHAPLPPLDFTRLGLLALDFKARAAADREPGEEG